VWKLKNTHTVRWDSLDHCFYKDLFSSLGQKLILPIL
jgi:hypothetical protein